MIMLKKTSTEVFLVCYDWNMSLEFPYQIVIFLNKEPQPNESVYYGENGWYPQMTIKRRFKLDGISEEEFIEGVKKFFENIELPVVTTGELAKPDRMPVQVIDIKNQDEMKSLHQSLLETFKNEITSRYPDRENDNYYAHITAEYNGELVIPTEEYTNKEFRTENIWLLKDVTDENSLAYIKIR